MLSYCMVTAVLHEFCHTALTLPYCIDTAICYEYGHIASIQPAMHTWHQDFACLQVQQQRLVWYMG